MKLAVVGAGGHSKVILDLIRLNEKNQIIAFLDDRYTSLTFKDAIYMGPIDSANQLLRIHPDIKFIIAIGNNRIRKDIVNRLSVQDECYATLIHPTAWISPSVTIGVGTVVMPQSVINADSYIGKHTIINTSAIIEHDNHISNYVHISPHATLTGAVKVEEGVHIGAGASVIPNIEIGEWSTIGAGATVIKSIPPSSTAVGVPAKVIKLQLIEGV
ncbi:acetyltransferase [Bacillus sp. Y1]|nr:acetyltransferase [Bacillus sp. Y1]AYA77608.1 acetyltransferase [Bacillus sp. Y1]